MRRILVLTGAIFSLGIGCSKNSSPTATTPAATNAAVPAVNPEANLANVLAELTQALRKYSVEQRKVPASLNDLIAAGYIKNPPQPPPGKNFGIDIKNLKVIVK